VEERPGCNPGSSRFDAGPVLQDRVVSGQFSVLSTTLQAVTGTDY